MQSPAKECAFCAATANITGEHLWSDWINRILGKRKYQITEYDERGAARRQYGSAALNLKTPVVCGNCNNGWMSDIENEHAKPAMKELILSDRGRLLCPEQIRSIALFAYKSLIIGDYSLPPGLRDEPFFSRTMRHGFANSLTIPDGFQMWFAAFKEKGHGIFQGWYRTVPPKHDPRYEFYTLTWGCDFFIFQALYARWLSPLVGRFPGFRQGSYWDKFSIPVWPLGGEHSILWPPKQLSVNIARGRFLLRWDQIDLPPLVP